MGNAAELRNEWPGVKRVRRERERERERKRERESGREIASSRASLNAARQYSGEARRDDAISLPLSLSLSFSANILTELVLAA